MFVRQPITRCGLQRPAITMAVPATNQPLLHCYTTFTSARTTLARRSAAHSNIFPCDLKSQPSQETGYLYATVAAPSPTITRNGDSLLPSRPGLYAHLQARLPSAHIVVEKAFTYLDGTRKA